MLKFGVAVLYVEAVGLKKIIVVLIGNEFGRIFTNPSSIINKIRMTV